MVLIHITLQYFKSVFSRIERYKFEVANDNIDFNQFFPLRWVLTLNFLFVEIFFELFFNHALILSLFLDRERINQ